MSNNERIDKLKIRKGEKEKIFESLYTSVI